MKIYKYILTAILTLTFGFVFGGYYMQENTPKPELTLGIGEDSCPAGAYYLAGNIIVKGTASIDFRGATGKIYVTDEQGIRYEIDKTQAQVFLHNKDLLQQVVEKKTFVERVLRNATTTERYLNDNNLVDKPTDEKLVDPTINNK